MKIEKRSHFMKKIMKERRDMNIETKENIEKTINSLCEFIQKKTKESSDMPTEACLPEIVKATSELIYVTDRLL